MPVRQLDRLLPVKAPPALDDNIDVFGQFSFQDYVNSSLGREQFGITREPADNDLGSVG